MVAFFQTFFVLKDNLSFIKA